MVPVGPQVLPSPAPETWGSSITELPTMVPSATASAMAWRMAVVLYWSIAATHFA